MFFPICKIEFSYVISLLLNEIPWQNIVSLEKLLEIRWKLSQNSQLIWKQIISDKHGLLCWKKQYLDLMQNFVPSQCANSNFSFIFSSISMTLGIDCDQARSEEERSMLNDAKSWRTGSPGKDATHPRSGATALHVAAAKGYIKVMK